MTTETQTMEYVAELTAELAKLTMAAGQPFVAYLLALAQAEAAEKSGYTAKALVVFRNPTQDLSS